MGFGLFIGTDWIHVQSRIARDYLTNKSAWYEYDHMLAGALEHVQSMDKAPSGALVRIMQFRLGQLTLRTGVVRKSLRKNGVKLEVFRDPGFDYVSGEWTAFDVDVGGIFPVSAHCFCISIDITHTRKENIKT